MLTMKALEVISKALDIIAADDATDGATDISHGMDTGEHGGDTDVCHGGDTELTRKDTDICHGTDTERHGIDTEGHG